MKNVLESVVQQKQRFLPDHVRNAHIKEKISYRLIHIKYYHLRQVIIISL